MNNDTGYINIQDMDCFLPKRKKDTHKGNYGRVLILGGCKGYTGAPTMCAQAALRAGAGLVYVGVPESIYEITAVKNTEAMPFPLDEDNDGLTQKAFEDIKEKLDKCDVCVIGPGMGRKAGTVKFVHNVVSYYKGKLIMDADAIYAIAQDFGVLCSCECDVVFTPHEGEFSQIYYLSPDKKKMVAEFAEKYSCSVVLKGPETLIALKDGQLISSKLGNPGMATGGSGDVLAGIIGGFVGQMDFYKAIVTGVYVHGTAGNLAAEKLGEYSMLPTDMIDLLPEVVKSITNGVKKEIW